MNSKGIILRKLTERPRAVSMVLGHLGASRQVMDRYVDYYSDRNCSVVTGTSPEMRFMLNASLKPSAIAILKETIVALKSTPPTFPLVIHLFSNGGAFLLYEIEQILLNHGDATSDIPRDDLELVSKRLAHGYQLFDSCPCYIRMLWDWKNLSQSFPHPSLSSAVRSTYTIGASTALTVWCMTTLAWSHPKIYWEHMRQSRLCLNNVYIYTTTDLLTDAFALEELIEHRRIELQANCRTMKFDDSNHCRLDKDHPEDYNKIMDDALAAAIQRCANLS